VTQEEKKQEVDLEMVRALQKAVGELIWLVTRTRLDIAYTVHRAATFTLGQPEKTVEICERLPRYLAGTADLGLWMQSHKASILREKMSIMPKGFHLEQMAFTDMSFAPFGAHSQEMVLVMAAAVPIQWKAGKQSLVATSTCEGELIVALDGYAAGRSIGTMLRELIEGDKVLEHAFKEKVRMAVDNQAAVQILSGQAATHWRTRHLRVKSAAIIEAVENGSCEVAHIPGTEQLADIGTKTLPAVTLEKLRGLAGMERLSELRGEAREEAEEEEKVVIIEKGKARTLRGTVAKRVLAAVVGSTMLGEASAG